MLLHQHLVIHMESQSKNEKRVQHGSGRLLLLLAVLHENIPTAQHHSKRETRDQGQGQEGEEETGMQPPVQCLCLVY
eukprot:scaffold219911_cov28-Attheya_sp.AAC.1